MELKCRYHPRFHPRKLHSWSFAEDKTATWKSYDISSQDPILPARNYYENCYKGTESPAAEMNQSRAEETHAQQELVLANPVCFVKETILMGQRKWIDIPANKWHQEDALSTEISKSVMKLKRRYDQDEREVDGVVHWDSMEPRLRNAFLKHGSSEF